MLDLVQRGAGHIRDFLCFNLRIFYCACHFCCCILRFGFAIVYLEVEIEVMKKGEILLAVQLDVFTQ